ncbi:MAG TPA: glycosyltransferase [Telluria sp.]|nr:glycosyltransferase [Telluria sp.]
MIAFHLPPMRGSSGMQRTLKFAHYLPEHGWKPILLSAHPRAYPDRTPDDAPAVPAITRAFALDTARHLSVAGRYPRLFAVPDRSASWALGAVPAALRLIRKHRPDAIWTTSPVATAQLIGLTLRRLTRLPWIADLRDPLTDEGYPADPMAFRINRWLEGAMLAHCSAAVFATPGALAACSARHAALPPHGVELIENGYDEADFIGLATAPRRVFTMLHSGLIYPAERDPRAMFAALRALLDSRQVRPEGFRLVLRATGHDKYLNQLVREHGIESIVEIAPVLPYREALAEMLGADALLAMQGSCCNHQIPAKLYEYLRARRPILALTDPRGDTARVLLDAGVRSIAPLDDDAAIRAILPRFVADVCSGRAPRPTDAAIANASRRRRTAQLARLLDAVALPAIRHALRESTASAGSRAPER